MKILHINTYDNGGAAKACVRLHMGLLKNGVDSKILFKHKNGQIFKSFEFENTKHCFTFRVFSFFIRALHKLGFFFKIKSKWEITNLLNFHSKGLEMISLPFSDCDVTKSELYKEADIIHLHWVSNFLDWKTFFKKNKKPIVWTLHDQNPFLGYEHYNERYLGINIEGYPVDRIKSTEELINNRYWINFKEKTLFNVDNINIVAPSKWLYKESMKSDLFNTFKHYYIPNGIPKCYNAKLNKHFSRDVFSLPIDKKILLFVADTVCNNRKGFKFLLSALKKIDFKNDVILCAIGSINDNENNEDIISLGRIEDEKLMAIAYSTADLFIIPSLEDNLPNTMLESLMCGTPVVGFPTGGITETIQDGFNGYLTPEISVDSLAKTIVLALQNLDLLDRELIKLDAINKYSTEIQAKFYSDLYETILNT